MEDRRSLLKTMLLIRRFEERVAQLFMNGDVPGMLHLYIGEEAVAAGVVSCLNKSDWITSTHRGHGHFLAKGADPSLMMAELMGKSTGYCGGKGGSMHIADIELGHLGANGIVGGGLTIATGAALASRVRASDEIVVCFFGDGALNIGEFHEALNMAGLWKLPVVYVCENNLYGLSTHIERACAVDDVGKRAAGYAMPSVTVDGMDVLAVRSEAEKAVHRVREGDGPTLMICDTYRFLGHSRSDPCPYRSKEEEAEWKARCPIAMFRQRLISEGEIAPSEFEEMDGHIHAWIDAAVEFAADSPEPNQSALLEGIYA